MPVVAETSKEQPGAPPDEPVEFSGRNLQRLFEGIVGSVRRLAGLQAGIWLHGVKSALLRMAVIAGLAVAALLLVIAAVPFLYTGLYHVLTDVLGIQTAWALLIFAGAHLALAGVLGVAIVLVARGGAPKGGAPGEVK